MSKKFQDFLDQNLTYEMPANLKETEVQRFNDSVKMLSEIKKLLDSTAVIVNSTEIPLKLEKFIEDIVENFRNLSGQLSEIKNYSYNSNPNNIFDKIYSFYNNFFEPSSSNKDLMVINAISNYETNIDKEFASKINRLNEELVDKINRADLILSKLEKPSSSKVLSDYANEYGEVEKANENSSKTWLIVAISASFLFITLVVLSICFEWFPATMTLKSSLGGAVTNNEIINFPILITKFMLISLIIYLILFCFKQYSIYKNLAVINQQKKNAFNSYVLFEAAIGENDSSAKSALLMSLAKSINSSINTGFLSSKQSEPLIQNVEVGKLFSDLGGLK